MHALQDNGIEAAFHAARTCRWPLQPLQTAGPTGFSRRTPALTVAANNTQAR
jgi:hypothetical protein